MCGSPKFCVNSILYVSVDIQLIRSKCVRHSHVMRYTMPNPNRSILPLVLHRIIFCRHSYGRQCFVFSDILSLSIGCDLRIGD